MQSQISTIDPVTVELHVEVPWERFQKGVEAEYGKLQRNARIKGFRQGKAPRNVIVQLFSRAVKEEVTSSLVNESVVEAVQRHELPVVSTPVLKEPPKLVDGMGLSFTVKVEVRPKIDALDTSLELVRRVRPVTDADVEAEIARIRDDHAVVAPLEAPRPAREGDVLTVDYTVVIDGAPRPDLAGVDRVVTLGDGRTLAEIDQALRGAEVGKTVTVTIVRPADDANTEIAGKVAVFDVAVKEVKERKLPALDDEFAKDVGDYASLEALRAAIRSRLEESARAESDRALREQAIETLVRKNPIPVPPSLLEQQMRNMEAQLRQFLMLVGNGSSPPRGMIDEMRPEAESKVRAALLLGEVAKRANITVTADDVEARLADLAERSGKHIAKVRVEYAGEKRERLESQILEDKLVRHLLDIATITDAPFEPADGSEGQDQAPTKEGA